MPQFGAYAERTSADGTAEFLVKVPGSPATSERMSEDTLKAYFEAGLTMTGGLTLDADPANPLEAATKQYVDGLVVGLLDFKGDTDCSADPNYPAGLKGDAYYVSVAGKIGGASGKVVEVGDVYVAKADNAGGTEASVGTSWFVLEKNLTGAATAGAITSSGLTMATARLLGRTTGSTGAVEEIGVGAGLSLSAGVLAATGGAAAGTSFPGSPSTGDRYYRTDRNIGYVYDGTRWLSEQVFTLQITNTDNLLPFSATAATHQARQANPWGSLYDIYVLEVVTYYQLVGTGNWTVTVIDQGGTLATVSGLTSTSPSVARTTVNSVRGNSTVKYFYFTVTENSGTATFYTNHALIYRLVG